MVLCGVAALDPQLAAQAQVVGPEHQLRPQSYAAVSSLRREHVGCLREPPDVWRGQREVSRASGESERATGHCFRGWPTGLALLDSTSPEKLLAQENSRLCREELRRPES